MLSNRCLSQLILASIFFSFNLSTSSLFAQAGATAVPFLTINPSALSRGMGDVGASMMETDAYSMYQNPALLGISDNRSELITGFFASQPMTPYFMSSNLSYFAFAVSGKYNFKKQEDDLPLSIGIGYFNQSIDLGTFIRIAENGDTLGRFETKEWANTISAAAVLDYWVRLGFGINYKLINSKLNQFYYNLATIATAKAYDFGLFANLPLAKKLKLNEDLDYNLDLTIATVLSNFGGKLTYIYESDPLPRTSKLSYTISTGINARILKSDFNAIVLNWSAEVQDLLVERDSLGSHYKTIYSGINLPDNLIMLKGSNVADVRHGLRVSLMNTLQYYVGYFSGPGYSRNSETNGWAIQSSGLFKVLDAYLPGSITSFLSKHIDITYYKVQSETKFPYSDFSVINLSYKNF